MMRVLFIARYRNKTMWQKVELLAQQPDLEMRFIFPARWQDDLLRIEQQQKQEFAFEQYPLSFVGPASDPHRSFYRSLDLRMRGFAPTIIHAEEEPDSLAALQIAIFHKLYAPKAKLLLHTWQNVDRPKSLAVRLVTKTTLQASTAVMCANQAAVQLLHKYGYRKPTPLLPPIGVDTRVFFPANKAKPRQDTIRIAYVGRLSSEKGIDTLLKAFTKLVSNRVSLLLVGEGPQRAELQALAHSLGINDFIQFTGALSLEQVAQQFRELDILVLPSRSTTIWQEQFGRVITEAMASKVVVVGSNSGAIPEVIGNPELIFAEDNPEALQQILQRLIENPNLHAKYAELGYQRVIQQYTQEQIANRTMAFYRQLGNLSR